MQTHIIRPRAPFDFEATARFLRFTEAEIVDNFDAGVYARALHFGGRLRLLSVTSEGTRSRPSLKFSLARGSAASQAQLRGADEFVRRTFSVEHDLEKFRAHVADDPLMSGLEAAHRGLHLPQWATLFESLVNSILSQQIATSVAWVFKRRLVERFGESLSVGGKKFYAFPLPSALARASVADLRALGVTNAKAQSIIETARAVDAGALDAAELARADNEEIIARLSQLRGVGRWTAEWVLMLYFGRTDVFAAADLFLRGAIIKYYNAGAPMTEREMREFVQRRFGAWQTYAAIYLVAGMRTGSITLKT